MISLTLEGVSQLEESLAVTPDIKHENIITGNGNKRRANYLVQ